MWEFEFFVLDVEKINRCRVRSPHADRLGNGPYIVIISLNYSRVEVAAKAKQWPTKL